MVNSPARPDTIGQGESLQRLEAVEICAGAGGQSLGLHLSGFEHKLAVELDQTAAATLQRNLARLAIQAGTSGPAVAVGDVADGAVWDPADYNGVDLLAGGVPCPPFSIAGRQRGGNDERDLFYWAVWQAMEVIRPKALLLENVRGLAMPRFSAYRQMVLNHLAEKGYWADWRLLEAHEFGVPQLRPRFVLVALHEEFAPYFRWPEPQPTRLTVGDALLDLMAENGWPGADAWAEGANKIAPTIVGGSKKHGGADLGPTRAKRAWAAMGVDGLGIADAAPNAEMPHFLMPKLTNEMVARLQGWDGPEYEWEFVGRKTSTYRQIGNAFPPPVARAVGTAISAALLKQGKVRKLDDRVAHDELVQELTRAGDFVPEDQLINVINADSATLARRLSHLQLDFVLERRDTAQGTAWMLGEFKAFRGQTDHMRHDYFAKAETRRRVS